MFLHQIDLTTALRPSLLPDEILLFVQDAIGLYEGKYKIPQYQNGQVYLTSHRACYVDNEEPRRNAVAIELKDVDRYEFYAGFLKSSPKITFYPKASKRLSLNTRGSPVAGTGSGRDGLSLTPPIRHGSPLRSGPSLVSSSSTTSATWICPICSFSNPVPSNFDPATANVHTPLPPCLTCGIKPPLVHVRKAAIAALSSRLSPAVSPVSPKPIQSNDPAPAVPSSANSHVTAPLPDSSIQCPRCTFENHPSLTTCEICGASLVSNADRRLEAGLNNTYRAESPGPSLVAGYSPLQGDAVESIKFSFRDGGEKIFQERLKNALIQRKWLLQNAPPIPSHARPLVRTGKGPLSSDERVQTGVSNRNKIVGIAGLERLGLEQRKNNEVVIGTAFEDLEALMTSAKEIIALAESFSSQANTDAGVSSEASAVLSQSASALGLVTTKDMLGSGSGSESLYTSELSRNLAEFLTDDTRGVLKMEGGVMTLVDLWAVFNRARGGVELISPSDFEKAARLWDKLKLPVRLRKFKSGLLVVQGRDRTDDKTIASLLAWLQKLHFVSSGRETTWDIHLFGRGVTAQETAEKFGWSLGIATEELEMAEENGVLCREQSLDGIRYWENWIVQSPR